MKTAEGKREREFSDPRRCAGFASKVRGVPLPGAVVLERMQSFLLLELENAFWVEGVSSSLLPASPIRQRKLCCALSTAASSAHASFRRAVSNNSVNHGSGGAAGMSQPHSSSLLLHGEEGAEGVLPIRIYIRRSNCNQSSKKKEKKTPLF